jgi:type I restriction enzyme S subunit
MDEIKSRAGGTTFAEISKGSFRPIPILVPEERLHDAWHRLADALHSGVVHNLRESQNLAALRDLLLPKLLSGEIRVAEAEERLEAAGA